MTTSATFLNRRIYRRAYALLAVQGVAHTPVSDFTAAASLFLREFMIDPQADKPYSMGGEAKPYRVTPGRFLSSVKPVAHGIGLATPKMIEALLRSWGGTWTAIGGGQYTLALTENLNEYATLGLVENKDLASTEKFVRVWDSWAHRIVLRLRPGMDAVEAEVQFAARDYDRTPMNALGGITLPASFAPAGMSEVFAPHSIRLFRDPAGANVSIACEELDLEFDQGFIHENFCDIKPLVKKTGYTTIKLRLKGSVSDETYAITSDAEAVTFKRFLATFTSKAGKVFSVDLKHMDFSVNPIGWQGGRFEFIVEGEAFMDPAETFVTITNTP